jgi:hypothetical protein
MSVPVTLPHGCWIDGVCHREAELRPLSGHDEAFLVDDARSLLPVQRATALLARCVTRIGDLAPVTRAIVRHLAVGDREALLLHLRRLTFGDRMQAVVSCPDPACGTKMDVPLSVGNLLVSASNTSHDRYEIAIDRNGSTYRAIVRVPTGADAEAAAGLAALDPARAADHILRACVQQILRDGERVDDVAPDIASAVGDAFADLDPQAELKLSLACVQCGRRITAIVDAAAYVLREIADGARQLHREVHLLAFHYHWAEAEILGMTPARRRRYLDFLVDGLQGRAS